MLYLSEISGTRQTCFRAHNAHVGTHGVGRCVLIKKQEPISILNTSAWPGWTPCSIRIQLASSIEFRIGHAVVRSPLRVSTHWRSHQAQCRLALCG